MENTQRKEIVGICGLWHLGSVLAACWSENGFKTVGFDYDQEKVKNLQAGRSPLYEPGLDALLARGISKNRLSFTSQMQDIFCCDYIFIAWDTDVRDDDSTDMSLLYTAIAQLSEVIKETALVIISSQVPVGTSKRFQKILQSKKQNVQVVYSPENLKLGEALKSYQEPGRIILGVSSDLAQERVLSLFKVISAEYLVMDFASAEMVKHGINSFLATSVTFTNNLADICEVTGASISCVIKGMKSDPRIGERAYLAPGIGFSGGTLGRDLQVLSAVNNLTNRKADLFEYIHTLNYKRKFVILNTIREICDQYQVKKIGILGITYKPGTSTLRRSLPLEIVNYIVEEEIPVSVYDPKADYNEYNQIKKWTIAVSVRDVILNSDLIILFTEWPEFAEILWGEYLRKDAPQIIFDTKNFLVNLRLGDSGYHYHTIGNS